jgi:hypothetical protein
MSICIVLNADACWASDTNLDRLVLQTTKPLANTRGARVRPRSMTVATRNSTDYFDPKPAEMEAVQWLRSFRAFDIHCRIVRPGNFQLTTATAAARVFQFHKHRMTSHCVNEQVAHATSCRTPARQSETATVRYRSAITVRTKRVALSASKARRCLSFHPPLPRSVAQSR